MIQGLQYSLAKSFLEPWPEQCASSGTLRAILCDPVEMADHHGSLNFKELDHVLIETGSVSCVDGPRLARIFLRAAWSLAVMCPAYECGRTWTAGPDGFRGLRPYQFVGITVP